MEQAKDARLVTALLENAKLMEESKVRLSECSIFAAAAVAAFDAAHPVYVFVVGVAVAGTAAAAAASHPHIPSMC